MEHTDWLFLFLVSFRPPYLCPSKVHTLRGVLPINGPMGMCRWMGSRFTTGLHFQQSSRRSYWNGVADFRGFGGKKILASGILKWKASWNKKSCYRKKFYYLDEYEKREEASESQQHNTTKKMKTLYRYLKTIG